MHIGPLFDYSIDDRQPVFAGKSMIDIFHYVAFNSNLCSNETNF